MLNFTPHCFDTLRMSPDRSLSIRSQLRKPAKLKASMQSFVSYHILATLIALLNYSVIIWLSPSNPCESMPTRLQLGQAGQNIQRLKALRFCFFSFRSFPSSNSGKRTGCDRNLRCQISRPAQGFPFRIFLYIAKR